MHTYMSISTQLQAYHPVILVLSITCNIFAGRILELKPISDSGKTSIAIICEDDRLQCSCTLIGPVLRWNDSPELTFNKQVGYR